uniref:Uncharacterized protein n=1 Tax=Tanacetum cinerariifolium TaxID=118510 RepID=A0A699GWR3_TANCI|nr:hypothetical protein [Tanacetum cinerariifolium]
MRAYGSTDVPSFLLTDDPLERLNKAMALFSETESEKQDTSSRYEDDADADNADISPIHDEEPMVEVQLTAECNIFATGQHHTEQPEIITEAQIQEKVFAIGALKNDLRKLKGNNVYTKFAKTSVLGKLVSQSLRNQSVVRQPNTFKSERPQMSKPRFASQVDVNNNLSRPVTQHYFPKRSKSTFSKPSHMIASSSSRNISKNLPRFGSNDMVHNHYLHEARKKTQERDRNSKTSVMPYARFQSTANDSKPKPRRTNHSYRSLPISKSSCVKKTDCVFNANHDACITNFLKEVNSRAKVQSNKTRNNNNPVEHIVILRTLSDLRWKPTGRIFNIVGLRWVHTGKILASCTSKDDIELTHGSNVDILNIHERKQTLDLSAGTSSNVQKEQSFDFSAGFLMAAAFSLDESRSKTSCSINHDKFMMKAQVHVFNSFTISNVQALPQKNIIDKITHEVLSMPKEIMREIGCKRSKP